MDEGMNKIQRGYSPVIVGPVTEGLNLSRLWEQGNDPHRSNIYIEKAKRKIINQERLGVEQGSCLDPVE